MSLDFRDRPNAVGHASPVAAASAPRAVRGFVIAGIGAIFLAVIGAVGTGEYPFVHRLGYWLLVMLTGALIGVLVSTTVHFWGKLRSRLWLEGAVITAVITLPLTAVVIVSNHLFFGGGFPALPAMAVVALVVMMFCGLMTAINYATATRPLPATEVIHVAAADPSPTVGVEHLSAPVPARTRLADRLPLHLRHARLLAIEAEDHYLRVHTDAGSDLILMRLTDAITEVDALPGARTHRSWWVARDAVSTASNVNGRTTLRLAGGLVVPVSRSFRPHLQADGWFG